MDPAVPYFIVGAVVWFLVVGLSFWTKAAIALKGKQRVPQWTVRRDQEPVSYWFSVGFFAFMGSICAWVVVSGLHFAN